MTGVGEMAGDPNIVEFLSMVKITRERLPHLREPRPVILAIENIQPATETTRCADTEIGHQSKQKGSIVIKREEYQAMGNDIIKHLKKDRRNGVMEWKLLIWCIERIQDQIQSEDQLLEWQLKLQEVINSMKKGQDTSWFDT